MDYSVLILSYNSEYKKTLRTIDSVLRQKNVSYEIIICDDGSKKNYFPELEEYLSDKQIPYKLTGGDENVGTVRNILRGLQQASGIYIKLIGSGDLLYNELTLYDVAEFMKNENVPCCFGAMRGFREKEGCYYAAQQYSPRDILAYREQNTKKICRNLMLCEDWVSGAAIFATTEYFKKYLSIIEGTVIYCEDWASAIAAVDQVFLKYLDQYVVWYELGDGISTSANEEFKKKLLQDNVNFWKLFDEYCEKHNASELKKYINKRKRKKRLDYIKNEKIKTIYKSLVNPDMVLYEFYVRRQERAGLHVPQTEATEGFLALSD